MAAGKRMLAFLCFVLLALSGCSASAGEYYREREHVGQTVESSEADANTVSNYYTLQTAVQNMIRAGRESDNIRIGSYKGDLDTDLEAIRRHFTTSYPLGVYAVQGIGYDKTRILSEMDLNVTVQYRKTPEEIRSIVEIPDDAEFERHMTEFFRSFSDEKVFSFTWITDSSEQFMNRVMKSWAAAAEYAVGLKEVTFTFYPEKSYRRIVEVNAQYIDEVGELLPQVQEIRRQADMAAGEIAVGMTDYETLESLAQWMTENIEIDFEATRVISETDGTQKKTPVYTAYGALVERKAAQSGLVLAADIVGSRLGLDCMPIIGTLAGEAYWWLAVRTEEGWLHLDLLSQEGENLPVQPDGENGETEQPEEVFVPKYIFSHEEAAARFEWDESVYELE